MSEIWNFSPSLKDQVQRCISAARKDEQNKWFQEFGHLTRNQNLSEILSCEKIAITPQPIEINSENVVVEDKADTEICKSKETSEFEAENIEEIVDSMETEFATRVDFIIEECVKNYNLLHSLALKLSTNTIEKLCKHICDKKDMSKDFISQYFQYFLPNYIKRSYNSATLDILVVSHKKYPLQFKLLLEILIKDTGMPKQVFQDFVQSLDEIGCSSLIMDLSEFDLTSVQFSSNIFSIYTAYKNCKKSERIQIYLQSLLIQHSSFCNTDRHFGRLLLTFLQTQKSLKIPVNGDSIENIIETHRSPFKRPCAVLLKELMGADDPNKSDSDDDDDSDY